MLTTVYC